jgi:tetratricopeptide (TPR) repeat protein
MMSVALHRLVRHGAEAIAHKKCGCMLRSPGAKIRREITLRIGIKPWLATALTCICASWGSPVVALHGQAYDDAAQEAISLERQGKNLEAEAEWAAVSRAHPASAEPFAHLGLLEARQEHYAEAIASYKKAMSLNPAMPGLRLNLGLAYFKAGSYHEAVHVFGPLLNDAPEDQRLTILMGMSHYGLDEFAAAIPYLKRASQTDPRNLPLLLTLAHSCLFSNQYPCVLDAYHRIIALNAESAEADMLVGEALDEMKDKLGAIREFRAAVLANPKEPNVHFGLGYLLWTKGQYPEAAREFQAEIDNDSHHVQAILYLADSEMQMNRIDDAKPLLEKLVKLNPDTAMGHLDLGIAYADGGSNEKALREFQMAAKIAPGNVNAHWRMARLYRNMGRTDLARSEFERAKGLNHAEDERLLKVMSRIPDNRKTPGSSGTPQEK